MSDGNARNRNGYIRQLPPKHRERLYQALRDRDGDNCCFCGKPIDFTLRRAPMGRSFEHRHRWSEGGSWNLDNLALAHKQCNQDDDHCWRKHRAAEEQFLERLWRRWNGGNYRPAWPALTAEFLGELE